MGVERMAGASARNQQKRTKADSIRQAAPALLALLADHRNQSSDASAHGASDRPAGCSPAPAGQPLEAAS